MLFGIVAFPHKKVQDIANSYRKRYDSHYALVPPHITIKDKFTLEDSEIDQVAHKLEKIGNEIAPFHIQLHKVSHFYPVTPTIYLDIEDAQPLHLLYQKIHTVLPEPALPYEFTPHLTIGQKMQEQELHDVYGRLRMMNFNLTSKIDRFHLMYQLENNSWNVYQSFILRNS